ncbi:MAG: primosomal protein N' [Cyclobacteriaceae bacterium]
MEDLSSNISQTTHSKALYAEVLLPVPIPKCFTYKIPDFMADKLGTGFRVIVEFGRKILTGIIWEIHTVAPEAYEPKFILDVIDDKPVISSKSKDLFDWMAGYYMCTPGEVMNAGVPTGLKLSSESKIQLHPDFSLDKSDTGFSDKELSLIKSLEFDKSITYPEAARILSLKNIYHILKSLINKQVVIIYEEIKEKYKPKKEIRIRLNEVYLEDESQMEALFAQLEKRPKQLDLVMKYLQLVPVYENSESNKAGISKNALFRHDLSRSSYKTLIKNDILHEFEVIIPRFKLEDFRTHEIELSDLQNETRSNIKKSFEERQTVLFHGITGSGKTEIYIQLIKEQLKAGKQVLYLLPEIALTTQIVERLLKIFGRNIGVYHSKYSDNERVEVWKGVLEGQINFVVGVRSSVFLPFNDLGLIIVDEEHETSYKQLEPAPRYHARDVALFLGRLHNAKTLLGSATPSLESYYLSRIGKYKYIRLDKRYGSSVLPEIKLVNTRQERKNKTLTGNFTSALINELKEVVDSGKQALLFQNRRGYSPFVICQNCGWIPQCEQCAVSLTYHMYKDELRCHYCGYRTYIPTMCKACSSTQINTVGFGTEKIEEDMKLILPQARVKRMDLDTTRSRYSYQQIINSFDQGDMDILIGTQMITKGLDFGNVIMVGIMDADQILNFPDFRSVEKAFQMMSQVSGRAGRRAQKGLVLVQTSNPEHPVFEKVINNDYGGMADVELKERKQFNYPPFSRIIEITVKHKDKEKSYQIARALGIEVKKNLPSGMVLGPEEPLIAKIRNEYLQRFIIKVERDKINLSFLKEFLNSTAIAVRSTKEFRSGKIVFNVDPV